MEADKEKAVQEFVTFCLQKSSGLPECIYRIKEDNMKQCSRKRLGTDGRTESFVVRPPVAGRDMQQQKCILGLKDEEMEWLRKTRRKTNDSLPSPLVTPAPPPPLMVLTPQPPLAPPTASANNTKPNPRLKTRALKAALQPPLSTPSASPPQPSTGLPASTGSKPTLPPLKHVPQPPAAPSPSAPPHPPVRRGFLSSFRFGFLGRGK